MSMFVQHKFIAPEHHVALESCVRSRPPLASLTVARLYRLALSALTPSDTKEEGVATSTIVGEGVTVGTATCMKTGVYVQLALVTGHQRPLLTVGKKWAVESFNPQQGHISTSLFTD